MLDGPRASSCGYPVKVLFFVGKTGALKKRIAARCFGVRRESSDLERLRGVDWVWLISLRCSNVISSMTRSSACLCGMCVDLADVGSVTVGMSRAR